MKKNSLSKLRKKLDALDEKLLIIIKKRTNLVNQVLKNKIDPNLTKRIWKSMIKGFIEYEYKNFRKK